MIARLAILLSLALPTAPLTADVTQDALNYLLQAMDDPARGRTVIAALRATADKDLTPFFTALAGSADKDRRRIAIGVLVELLGPDAAPTLLERLQKDPVMDIRSEALVELLELKAVSTEQLLEAIKVPDEKVQCLAARALVQKGRGAQAVETLRKLTASRELATSSMARVSLLGMGQSDQLAPVRQVLTEPNTPPVILGLLLDQIAEEKVVAAADAAREVARSTVLGPLKSQAYKTLAAVSAGGSRVLKDAIVSPAADPVLTVMLMKYLADAPDAQPHLKGLSDGNDVAGALARLELARKQGGDPAAKAATEAVALEHPVVIVYVLDRAAQDIAANGEKADFYTAALLKCIRSVQPNPRKMDAEHMRAAQAATLLADLGAPDAMDGLKTILAGRYDAVTRSAAAGLLRTRNRAACDLARPLLKSPYNELVSDAALVLGRFGDAGGTEFLSDVLARSDRHRPELVALASWYLIKIAGRTKLAAEALAKAVK